MDYIIYFMITIGILVFVHEFGHFAAAKISKMRVDIFAIGFGKRLFGWNKLTRFTFGDLPKDFDGQGNTDYRLCLLPLGGYVKIAGMVDESFDTKFAESEPKPYEFRAKKTLPKLFVITAGVMMNLTLTLIIFWGINFFQGKLVFKTTTINKVEPGSDAQKAGFQSYDKILSVNGEQVNNWQKTVEQLFVQNSTSDVVVKVQRDGKEKVIAVERHLVSQNSKEGFFIQPRPSKSFIIEVMKNSPAENSGMKAGDIFVSISRINIDDGQLINDIISSNKEKNLQFILLRDNDTVRAAVIPGSDGKIGVSHRSFYSGQSEFITYNFFSSITHALDDAAKYTALTFGMLKNVITGKIAFKEAFGGPIKIAQIAVASADKGGIDFLFFLAMLSLSLAIINILPFPVLDGGHFVIILLEGLFRKELPIKIKMAIQNAGFVLLLLLMAFIIYNDIISL
ncbi:MAG: RIP metalloprotease RseP [Ignavibacteriales bacterium]|nr:MAG: RIP metalloprotease RseP [Ignavibacteriales bacterium]